jgi:hypothetical protein
LADPAGQDKAQNPIDQKSDHLKTALRLIKLRWDGLDDHDRASGNGSSFGVYFTARQLEALEGYFHRYMKDREKQKSK